MNPRQIFPASPNAACVDIPIYLFDHVGTTIYPLLVIADNVPPKDGQPPITIATQAVGIGGTGMYAWLSWQPNSAARLGLGFDNTIPEGAFEMYRHEDGIWAVISEPHVPSSFPGVLYSGVARVSPTCPSWPPGLLARRVNLPRSSTV